jgi:hypothetical protein
MVHRQAANGGIAWRKLVARNGKDALYNCDMSAIIQCNQWRTERRCCHFRAIMEPTLFKVGFFCFTKEMVMFKQETIETPNCPNCGNELEDTHGELRCDEHGTFFAYGPNLLVRAATTEQDNHPNVQMPWEQAFSK